MGILEEFNIDQNAYNKPQVQVAYLQKNERYPCTKRQAREMFGDLELEGIGLGSPMRHFTFDSRCRHRPNVREDTIVCEAVYSPRREGWFSAYAMRKEFYPLEARADFLDRVLPKLRSWLQAQIAKPDTAVSGHEYLIVQWDGATHQFHAFRQR